MKNRQLLHTIAVNVLALRTKKRWSQEALSLITDVHKNHIGFIERERADMRVSTLAAIAKGLEVDIATLLVSGTGE